MNKISLTRPLPVVIVTDGTPLHYEIEAVINRNSRGMKKRCVIGGDKCDIEFYLSHVSGYAVKGEPYETEYMIDAYTVYSHLEMNENEAFQFAEQTIQSSYQSIGSDLFNPEYE